MAEDLDVSVIQEAIRKRYAEVACTAAGKFGYPTGRAGAVGFGYDAMLLKDLPDTVLESFCGVGNPFSLGAIYPGEVVLDVGCGAGFDVMVRALSCRQNMPIRMRQYENVRDISAYGNRVSHRQRRQ